MYIGYRETIGIRGKILKQKNPQKGGMPQMALVWARKWIVMSWKRGHRTRLNICMPGNVFENESQ